MDKEKQEEENKLIAEFIGWNLCDCGIGIPHYKYGESSWQSIELRGMNFSTNWNSLMPIIQKICVSGDYWVQLNSGGAEIGKRNEEFEFISTVSDSMPPYSIAPVYKAVIMFIKWYNERKN